MASLSQLRTAIGTTLRAGLTGVRVSDTIPDKPEFPAVVIVPSTADFEVAMGRGTDTYRFELQVLDDRASSRRAQLRVDGLVSGSGAGTVRGVIWANRSLGLADTHAHVEGMTDYGVLSANGFELWAATLTLVVHTKGS